MCCKTTLIEVYRPVPQLFGGDSKETIFCHISLSPQPSTSAQGAKLVSVLQATPADILRTATF